jgi:hypothetical protein
MSDQLKPERMAPSEKRGGREEDPVQRRADGDDPLQGRPAAGAGGGQEARRQCPDDLRLAEAFRQPGADRRQAPPAQKEVQSFGTTSAEVLRLQAWLVDAACTHVAMESTEVAATVVGMNVTAVRTAPRSPCQNAHLERLIGSIRRECLDHVVVVNEVGVRRVLASYVSY